MIYFFSNFVHLCNFYWLSWKTPCQATEWDPHHLNYTNYNQVPSATEIYVSFFMFYVSIDMHKYLY